MHVITCTGSRRPEEEAGTLRTAAVALAVAAAEAGRRIRRSAAVVAARGIAVPQEQVAGNGAGRRAEAAEEEETSTMTGETAAEGGSTIPRPIVPAGMAADRGTEADTPSLAAVLEERNAATAVRGTWAEMDTQATLQLVGWGEVGSTPIQRTAVAGATRMATRMAMRCWAGCTAATSGAGRLASQRMVKSSAQVEGD